VINLVLGGIMDYKARYNEWLEKLSDTDPLKSELQGIAGDEKEIEDRFYQDLSFGTAGLRGKVGAGTNRMNFFTVGKATQGVADFIVSKGKEACEKGVVIAHDPRHFSKEFSQLAAGILQQMESRFMYSQILDLHQSLHL
jgi:phosphoglucomutase